MGGIDDGLSRGYINVYKHSDPYTLTSLGRLWTGTGVRGGVSPHSPAGRHPAFSVLCGGRRSRNPRPGCCPQGGGGIEARIVYVVRLFWNVGGSACALGKPTTRERRRLTSEPLFHSSHRATHLGEERDKNTHQECFLK